MSRNKHKSQTKPSPEAKPKLPTIGDLAIVTPCEGRRVRNPKSGAILPPAGAKVWVDQYWLRRRIDKDVVLSFVPATLKSDTPVAESPGEPLKGSEADTEGPPSSIESAE